MKKECFSVSKLLEKYFDRQAAPQERSLVEAHLPDCPACRESLRSMERLRHLIATPVQEAAEREDFPWVWQEIERGVRLEENPNFLESLRNWLDVTLLLRKKIVIPAAAVMMILVLITASFLFKKTPSLPVQSVVEYVESQTHNVMIYELENAKLTVIWLFETPDKEISSS